MNDTQKQKLNRFLNDEVMSKSVYEVLLQSYLRPKERSDVNLLAASRLAIDLLQEGWKELAKYQVSDGDKSSSGLNVGL